MSMPDHTRLKLTPFEFTGKAGEYFGIWIINLLLTIVTLGIYSAWAKVRNTQYIYSHTRLQNASFEYTAKPIDILKGRLIAVAFVVLYITVSKFWPLLEFVFILAFLIILPFLIVTSLRYRYRNSLYRNIPFNFTGTYGQAVKEFLLWPLLMFPTAGLLFPYIRYRQSNFLVNNSHYGNGQFNLNAKLGPFFMIYLKAIGLFFLAIAIIIGLIALSFMIGETTLDSESEEFSVLLMIGSMMIIYPMFGVIFLFISARTRNLIYTTTNLETHGLESNVSARTLTYLWITNILAIIFTLGLALPWVTIRMARYYAQHTHFLADGDINHFVQQQVNDQNAMGQEMADILDIDIGL